MPLMLHTVLVWYHTDPSILRLAKRSPGATLLCAHDQPSQIKGVRIVHLDDAKLAKNPPHGVEGYLTPAQRFSIAAAEVVRTMRGPISVFAPIAYAPAFGILQDRRCGLASNIESVTLFANPTRGYIEHLDRLTWWDLDRGITELLERESAILADVIRAPMHTTGSRVLTHYGVERNITLDDTPHHDDHKVTPQPAVPPESVIIADAFAPRRGIVQWLRSRGKSDIHPVHLIGCEGTDAMGKQISPQAAAWIDRYQHHNITMTVLDRQPDTWINYINNRDVLIAGDPSADALLLSESAVHARNLWMIPGNIRDEASKHDASRISECPHQSLLQLITAPSAPAAMTGKTLSQPTITYTSAGPPAVNAPVSIDVIIPFYNLSSYLPETIASLDAQEDRDFHTYIINDGSTQPQAAALLSSLERRPATTVVHTVNGGLSAARNTGLRVSTATHALVLDADDLISPAYIRVVRRAAQLNPLAAVIGTYMKCFYTDTAAASRGWAPTGFDRNLLLTLNTACPASCLLRRDAVLPRGYNQNLTAFEDWDLWCYLASCGHFAVIVPEFLFMYRQRHDSMYHSLTKDHEATLRMQLAAAHPALPTDMSKALRLEIALRHHETVSAPKPRRYELADKLHFVARRTGIHRLWRRGGE